tara:strand:+ start:802 stop:966 length:165 start_codon:yes stop_codon:yes gene_type:complete
MGSKNSKIILWFSNKKNNVIEFLKKKKYNYENRRTKEIYMKVFSEELDHDDNII